MKLLRLPRAKVQIGTPLPWNVRDEHSVLLLSRGHIVETEHQLEALLRRGAFVDIEEVRASASVSAPSQATVVARPLNLFGLWNQTAKNLKALLDGAKPNGNFTEHIDLFANHIVQLTDLNVDIGIYCSVRQDHEQHFYYGYNHALHTAGLCLLIARHLQWSTERTMSLVKAALTMNMSILELQGQMAAQDGPLKDKQRVAIHAHPSETVALLESLGVTDDSWLEAIMQHHERSDGSGYPLGLTDFGEMAVALRVADVFMAKISPRALRAALTPIEAVRQLYQEDHGGPISVAVVKSIGVHPPGDFVKLASGELGVVVQRTKSASAPIVASITDTAGRPVTHTPRRDTCQAEFKIVGPATDKALLKRLPPERLYGFSAVPALPQMLATN